MAKYVCTVCGYVYEGENPPEFCPVCKQPASKLKEQSEDKTWAAEHVVGVAQGAPEDIMADLRANFEGECSEVGMYLAMARVAHREGYPEIGLYWEKAAFEEAEHAAKFAELLGEVVTDSTKKNLEMRVDAEHGATEGKFDLAKRAKALKNRIVATSYIMSGEFSRGDAVTVSFDGADMTTTILDVIECSSSSTFETALNANFGKHKAKEGVSAWIILDVMGGVGKGALIKK